jgi:hypothetical protein
MWACLWRDNEALIIATWAGVQVQAMSSRRKAAFVMRKQMAWDQHPAQFEE